MAAVPCFGETCVIIDCGDARGIYLCPSRYLYARGRTVSGPYGQYTRRLLHYVCRRKNYKTRGRQLRVGPCRSGLSWAKVMIVSFRTIAKSVLINRAAVETRFLRRRERTRERERTRYLEFYSWNTKCTSVRESNVLKKTSCQVSLPRDVKIVIEDIVLISDDFNIRLMTSTAFIPEMISAARFHHRHRDISACPVPVVSAPITANDPR